MMQSQATKNQLLIPVLMITIIIDVMGVGLVFPIIPEIILSKSSLLFTPDTTDGVRNFYYGLTMAVWPFGVFIGSALIGRLSDIYGRKNMLILSLAGNVLSYLISVAALYSGSLSLFIISRLLCGFFGGSFSIAQAVILDISNDENRVKNLSLVTLSASIGFIIGPLVTTLVGMLANTSALAAELPFWFGALLAFINVIFVWRLLSETFSPPKNKPKLKVLSLILSFRVMFIDKRIRLLALSFLMLQIGWGYYAQSLPLLLDRVFHFSQSQIGAFFIIFSLGFALSTLFVQEAILKRFKTISAMLFSAIIVTILIILSNLIASAWMVAITAFFGSMFEIVFYTGILSLLSQQVETHEQGAIMGGTSSVFGIAWFINAFSIGGVVAVNLLMPFYLAAIAIAIAGIFALLHGAYHQPSGQPHV
ncbi:MAG: MFS transporter [Francisellaceae bacterium]